MTLPMSGIYCITNTTTGKCYVGQSKNVYERVAVHFRALRHGIHENRLMQKEWNENNRGFRYDILVRCPLKDLNEQEKFWIDKKNSMCPHGYNLDWVPFTRYTKEEPKRKVKGYHKTS